MMTIGCSDRHVLVAEDDGKAALSLANTIRTRLRCAVSVVPTGDGALAELAKDSYDLLITDMLMPGTHGVELVQRVAEQFPDVDILVTTAYPEDFPYVELVRAGAAGFLMKPYPADELEAAVLQLFMRRHRDGAGRARENAGLSALSDAQYRSVFEFNVNGMLILDPEEYRIKDANHTFCRIAGLAAEALADRCLFDLLEEDSRRRLLDAFVLFARTGQGSLGDAWLLRPDGKPVCLDISVSFIRSEPGDFVQVSCRDSTEQHQLQRQLAEFAQTDPLTRLLNKRMLFVYLEGAIAQARQTGQAVTLLFADLDNFKYCNDTQGHQAGDGLLKLIADLVRTHTRDTLDLGFRYGGDEFAVLLRGADASVGAAVGERIRSDYASQERFGTSISIGVAQLRDGMDADTFVKEADAALYRAKLGGKNQVSVA
ncbi:MAG: diguanylate cyclase [Candidatus Hydrogenedentes bacterium]|nr:diguanylate cyclase [Candidatus Hydrogenedentota bacterium]